MFFLIIKKLQPNEPSHWFYGLGVDTLLFGLFLNIAAYFIR
jgi:hypothetical protein